MGSMEIFGLTADALEYLGAGIILVSFVGGAARALGHYLQKRENVYDLLKFTIGRGLLLGLEFLVAADIIRTIMIETTIKAVAALGLLIVVRTVLSWSIVVEIEGCWPWQLARNRKDEAA